jgi:hypothetical protein
MSLNQRDYEAGRGKPPVRSRFKKGQSGNPRGSRPKNLPALLVEALDEPVVVTIDGERREITKREAVVTQLVNKSTGADLHATKMLIDTLKGAEKNAGVAPPSEPAPFTVAGRGGHGDLHHKAAAILGGGASREGHGEPRVVARTMTAPDKFTPRVYETLLRLDFVSFAQRCFRELSLDPCPYFCT